MVQQRSTASSDPALCSTRNHEEVSWWTGTLNIFDLWRVYLLSYSNISLLCTQTICDSG
jgi:hypothetical protein